ncbi:hypothetical protein GmHk_07G020080 [Glycine max]|nr:hypothetical protein GmHk_07G020080 [Glycine max]
MMEEPPMAAPRTFQTQSIHLRDQHSGNVSNASGNGQFRISREEEGHLIQRHFIVEMKVPIASPRFYTRIDTEGVMGVSLELPSERREREEHKEI